MWVDIFLASIWGGFVALDTTALLQIMISRPLVSCSIVGLLLGNFPLGFLIGILSELFYISELPVGAAKFAESNVGATAAATIAILVTEQLPTRPYMVIASALILTVMVSSLGGRLVLLMRTINGRIYEKMAYKESLAPRHINAAQVWGIVMAFVLGFISVFVSSAAFSLILLNLLKFVPDKLDAVFQPATGAALAVGCVFLAQHFWKQNSKKGNFVIGLGIGALLFFVLM